MKNLGEKEYAKFMLANGDILIERGVIYERTKDDWES